jgi:hypothetical protein
MMATDAIMDPQATTTNEQREEEETQIIVDQQPIPNYSDPNLPMNLITKASSSNHPIGMNINISSDPRMGQRGEPSADDTLLFQQRMGNPMVVPQTNESVSTSIPKSNSRIDSEIKLEPPLSQADFEHTLSELVNPDGGLASITLIDSLVLLMSRSLSFLQKCLILNLLGCTAEDRLKLRK